MADNREEVLAGLAQEMMAEEAGSEERVLDQPTEGEGGNAVTETGADDAVSTTRDERADLRKILIMYQVARLQKLALEGRRWGGYKGPDTHFVRLAIEVLFPKFHLDVLQEDLNKALDAIERLKKATDDKRFSIARRGAKVGEGFSVGGAPKDQLDELTEVLVDSLMYINGKVQEAFGDN